MVARHARIGDSLTDGKDAVGEEEGAGMSRDTCSVLRERDTMRGEARRCDATRAFKP